MISEDHDTKQYELFVLLPATANSPGTIIDDLLLTVRSEFQLKFSLSSILYFPLIPFIKNRLDLDIPPHVMTT